MLVESKQIRDLLNTSVLIKSGSRGVQSAKELLQAPRTYGVSLNPLPALIILLLGIMMGSHHQASMVSTMVHKQWGTLFVGASLARGVSYILTYLSPPTSLLPSRPPSEIITAFCLISGGLIFMASVCAPEQAICRRRQLTVRRTRILLVPWRRTTSMPCSASP